MSKVFAGIGIEPCEDADLAAIAADHQPTPSRQDLIDAYHRTAAECDRASANVRRLMRRYASWRRSYRAQFGAVPDTLDAVWLARLTTAQDHADATAAQLVEFALELIGSEEPAR